MSREKYMDADAPLMSRDSLRALAAHFDRLSESIFDPGHIVEPGRRSDGVVVIGYAQLSEASNAFLDDAIAAGWVRPFDWVVWMTTPEGRRLLSDQSSIASATADQLSKVLTAHFRRDRFADGTLLEAFKSGVMKAVAARAAVLLDALDQDRGGK